MRGLCQFFRGSLDGGGVFAFHDRFQRFHLGLDISLEACIQLVAEVIQRLLRAVDQAVGMVARFNDFLLLFVVSRMGFSLAYQILDLSFRQAGRGGDLNGLLLAGAEIFG